MAKIENVRPLRDAARASTSIDAILVVRGKMERTVVCDISTTGVGLIGSHSVSAGDLVSLQMSNGRCLDARVCWRDPERCGLELLQPFHEVPQDLNGLQFGSPIPTRITSSGTMAIRRCGFVGESELLNSVCERIALAASSNASVLISGESGTGKDLCADAIHRLSDRNNNSFVVLNCAAIPRDLFESEIFGHVKGSFSGAAQDRLGAALQAHGGTLFLDEVGELELGLQGKLLRFLQTGQVKRVGEDRLRNSNARVIYATNRDLRKEVSAGRFREDLFYRIMIIPIWLPALRARREDIIPLAKEFLIKFSQMDGRDFKFISASAQALLVAYHWPGNVRELQSVIRTAIVMNKGDTLDKSMLLPLLQSMELTPHYPENTRSPIETSVSVSLSSVVERAIDEALIRCEGSIPKAASQLMVSPSTIYRHLQSRKNGTDVMALKSSSGRAS